MTQLADDESRDPTLTVQQLIDQLDEVSDKTLPVWFETHCCMQEVGAVTVAGWRVVIDHARVRYIDG